MKQINSTIAAVLLMLSMFLPQQAISQAPEKMSFQAVIRDSNDDLVTNAQVGIQISILQGSASGTVVYSEAHSPTTNVNGLVSIEIGGGPGFGSIVWGSGLYFIKTETDPTGGTNYTISGTSQLLSVPYALHAKTAESLTINIHSLLDADGDTKIQVEENPNEDIIRFDMAGTEFFKMDNGRLEVLNTGQSVFIGEGAGSNDDLSDNENVAIGRNALAINTNGDNNVAIGSEALKINSTGNNNTAIGSAALKANSTGDNNTALGYAALLQNTTGDENTVAGYGAMWSNSTGFANTAMGFMPLFSNTNGVSNTAIGHRSLWANTIGSYNVALGRATLSDNTEGDYNTAIGYISLWENTTGDNNTALGEAALQSNTTADDNTAVGKSAMQANTTGYSNTSCGVRALTGNTTGDENTATGFEALRNNTTGIRGTAVGYQALYTNTSGNYNTALGYKALYSKGAGNWNTAIGRQALFNLTSGTNNMGFGYDAQVPSSTGSNQIRMGNTSISSATIQVNWSATSDKRWKEQIRELPYGLDFVKQLKPVDYVRKNNEHETREMGFIAQDVEALLDKVGYTDQGFLHKDDKGYMSLRYNDFIALLTKAIQEQQVMIDELKQENINQAEAFNSNTTLMKELQSIINQQSQK